MPYVIACGDEGVQFNQGTRLGVVGAGFRIEGFSAVVKSLKKLFGKELFIASSEENDWAKKVLDLTDWEQVSASMQQHIEALADREKIVYAGHIGFTDPRELKSGVKAHMVRPHNVHVANKICFTLAGGEQKFNLGCYVISAEWVSGVDEKIAKSVISEQVEFYKALAKKELKFVFETGGELGPETAAKNQAVLEKLGFVTQ